MSSRASPMIMLAVLMMGAVPLFVSCKSSPDDPGPASARAAGMTLHVQNHNTLDVRVFLVRDGQRQKIGTVPSMTGQVFEMSAAELGGALELRLFADPIGSHDSFSTQPIPIQAGATIEWQLEKDIRRSSVMLR